MENLIKTRTFFSFKNDMWVWIGTKKDGTGVYNWMHGDDYDTFSKEYCKPDELIVLCTKLELKMEEAANK